MKTFILLFGALESALLALLFFRIQSKHKSLHRMFALMLLFCCLDFLYSYYLERNEDSRLLFLIPADTLIALIQNPLLFFYSMLLCKKKITRSWRHFIPLVVYLLLCIPYWMMDGSSQLEFIQGESLLGLAMIVFDLLVIPLQFLLYALRIFRNFNRRKEELKGFYSSLEHKKMAWFQSMILLLGVLYLILMASLFTDWIVFALEERNLLYLPLYLAFLCFIQVISYKMLVNPDLLFGFEIPEKKPSPSLSSKEIREIEEIASMTDRYMQEKQSYLDPDLNLADLAEQLGITLHRLSRGINSHFNKNFYDYVNQYRVEHVKRLLKEEEDIRILEAAFASGFNSKSAFNAVFRKLTGLTPSEYRKKLSLSQ